MSEFERTFSAVGVGGLLLGLAQCDDADRELAASDASLVVPDTVVQQPAQLWRMAVQMCVILLMQTRDVRQILLLGNDICFLEALKAVEYDGITQLLLSPVVGADECRKIAQNVPVGLDVEVLTPGLVPVLQTDTTVLVIGFDAGGGYVMVEAAASHALGSLHGQRFAGDVIAMLPFNALTVHERLANWQMVPHDHYPFTEYCRPDGLEPVPDNV